MSSRIKRNVNRAKRAGTFRKRRMKKSWYKNPRSSYSGLGMKVYTQNIGLPKVKKVKLHYSQYVPFVSTSGASTNAVFNMTSIFDPDNSGIGHQPLGHDEWAQFYKNYTVIGAQATFTFFNVGTNAIPCRVGVILDEDGAISSVLSTKVERSAGRGSAILNTNSRERQSITVNFSPKKAFDLTNLKDEDGLTISMSSNPALTYMAVPWVQSIDSATTSGTVGCDVKITYICLLTDPVDIIGS